LVIVIFSNKEKTIQKVVVKDKANSSLNKP